MLAGDNAREGFMEPAEFEAMRTHLPAYLADAAAFGATWLLDRPSPRVW